MQARAKELSEEATFKERQLESSQATMARLLAEKEQRAQEVRTDPLMNRSVESSQVTSSGRRGCEQYPRWITIHESSQSHYLYKSKKMEEERVEWGRREG